MNDFIAALSALAATASKLNDDELIRAVGAATKADPAVKQFIQRMAGDADLPTRRPSRDYKPGASEGYTGVDLVLYVSPDLAERAGALK